MKKIITLVLAIALVGSSVSGSVSVQAASVEKISVKVGDTKKLKVWKKNNTYKVSGKKYVSVTNAGKVKALKTGTAVVTVKHGKRQKKFKITIKPVYLSVDYNKITKATVYNLNTGENVDLDGMNIQVIKDILQKKNLVRDLTVAPKKPKSGSGKYGIHLYNAAGKELYNIAIYSNYVKMNQYSPAYKGDVYKPKKALDLKALQALFQ